MTINDITIGFTFKNIENGLLVKETADFFPTSTLETDIDDYAEQWTSEQEEDYELVDTEVVDFDNDYADPDDFNSLEEYGEYADGCEKYGEAFKLRFEDVTDPDMDEYEGCWDDEEAFVKHIAEECMEIPDNLWGYIDWEKLTRDIMMDYSVYEGDEGVHIFRN